MLILNFQSLLLPEPGPQPQKTLQVLKNLQKLVSLRILSGYVLFKVCLPTSRPNYMPMQTPFRCCSPCLHHAVIQGSQEIQVSPKPEKATLQTQKAGSRNSLTQHRSTKPGLLYVANAEAMDENPAPCLHEGSGFFAISWQFPVYLLVRYLLELPHRGFVVFCLGGFFLGLFNFSRGFA